MSLPSFLGDMSMCLWGQGKGTFSKDDAMHVALAERIREWNMQHESLLRLILLIMFLYLFIFSLELMSASLKMFGKEFARSLIYTTTNPVAGLFIGILATSIIQSSSSTTSIVVGMENAIDPGRKLNKGSKILSNLFLEFTIFLLVFF